MNRDLEKYLDSVDKYLKSVPISERVDIVKEIKASILEMEREGISTKEILIKLGNPKDMANAYLADALTKNNDFNWHKYLSVFAFYSLAGLSGAVVIPTLAIIAPVFILTGIVIPIAGFIKLLGYLLNFNVPFIMMEIGSLTIHPILAFIITVPLGILFYILGHKSWKLLLKYIQNISSKKKDIL